MLKIPNIRGAVAPDARPPTITNFAPRQFQPSQTFHELAACEPSKRGAVAETSGA